VDLVVADLSFISLVPVLPALGGLCRPKGPLVLLVKPQFEAGRAEVSRGRGVVRDPAVRADVQRRIDDALRAAGATIMGWMESPLRGSEGNVELFVHAQAPNDEVHP
jgi:23S rRNA (cytidine1920-2'-O)/16S rRNA (cytidine1409-2'-O)-methyltransferase